LLELCQEFQDRFFIIFTNGTALKEADFALLKRLTNVSIIVSIEGGQDVTDERRGDGVYEKAVNTLQRLGKMGVLSGISVTINRLNYKYWMDSAVLDNFVKQGVRLGFFIEYIPTAPGSADTHQPGSYCPANPNKNSVSSASAADDHALMLSREERELFRTHVLQYRASNPIYIIHSPGDEEFFGGCVSAGRGFAHVTPTGDLTPCPVSNVATHNLGSATLSQGLASPLFRLIRENEHLLETEDSPCGLFAHPREVDELARAVGAYRTNCK
jgi:MoaA/NifB/PqqE/SkfB family radical SAM enzyme